MALVGFIAAAHMLALGLVGGYLADSASHKSVLVSTQEGAVADRVSAGVALALNVILGAVSIGLIAPFMPSLRERMEPDSRRGETRS